MHFAERLYPQAKLESLLSAISPSRNVIDLSVGEPNVPLNQQILSHIPDGFEALARYPKASLQQALLNTIRDWLCKRYLLDESSIDAQSQITVLAGSREGIFMMPIALFNRELQQGLPITVAMPDPGYPIYQASAENVGANICCITQAQLAQLTLNGSDNFASWADIDLMFVCSPNNPTGEVLTIQQWTCLIALAKKHQFVLVADECYSEIYSEPFKPVGLLEACKHIGNVNFENCLAIHSLSKRSGLPGLRSGFVAGDKKLIKLIQGYRNYHGVSLSPIQLKGSEAAWADEQHVVTNRAIYQEKFDVFTEYLGEYSAYELPQGGFYIWLDVGCDSEKFCQHLYQHYGVKVLPGHYLAVSDEVKHVVRQYVRVAVVCHKDEVEQVATAIKKSIAFFSHSNVVGDHVA
ncbi:aminotransferase class I/II-fold pyridoxal phosphate-dependent enzyme [Pseudoalteromonas luteoviolacea]|uniref:aminotransferase class I/II-fold pyridoxal phosphate-dependent enzyme n=1 Tax=Pseudoalteromonas luteoviolacea TaxID=43657 RepID=UPI001EED62C9|nr:aminotransferase class I/II-fold pyridoxal phosphate-dependent enzyme [Pseudoalteromonas luteoviolacea]MCF6441806.1 aminotransferase class I/II-fold pyridoxal phosphate-dependent enzyme [Pseudoalteromonas luteoviolacea]